MMANDGIVYAASEDVIVCARKWENVLHTSTTKMSVRLDDSGE